VTEIRTYRADGQLNYIMYEMPLAGFEVSLELDEDENPIIIVGSGVVEYTFTPVE